MGCLLKSFVKILQTAKLSKLSKQSKSSESSKLSKQSKSSEPSKLSMPSSFNPLDTRTLREILEFARRSGKICPSQKLEYLCEFTRQVNEVVANSKPYFTMHTDEPNYVDTDVFLRHHKEMMESLGQKQHLINAHSLESALYRLK
ncbi:3973_t:CDS:2 [Rhizophagus irregularis]|nr:3973_t:CDS:2 [Rhizophagus irregularis]